MSARRKINRTYSVGPRLVRLAFAALLSVASVALMQGDILGAPPAAVAQSVPTQVIATDTAIPSPAPTDMPTPLLAPTASPFAINTGVAIQTQPASATNMPLASTGTPSPSSTPPSVTPTPTPTTPVLGPVTAPSPPDTVKQGTVDAGGGAVITADGRVALAFPAGAVPSTTNITIRTLGPSENLPPLPEHVLMSAWQLEAVAASGGAAVSAFAQPIGITLRVSDGDAARYNVATMRLWTLDKATNTWQSINGTLDGSNRAFTTALPHFSVYGLSLDSNFNTSLFSDSSTVGLQSGAAQLSVPLSVPPGPGGLTPDLALSYDSDRASGMHTPWSLGSWAGIGWQLGSGSISGSLSSDSSDYDPGYALSLSMNGISGRIEDDYGTGTWYMSDHTFERIQLHKSSGQIGEPGDCQNGVTNPCYWVVTDKKGTQYIFGQTTDSRRVIGTSAIYQWDLSSITDTSGNSITFSYAQLTRPENPGTTADSYLQHVSWDGGLYTVDFNAVANRPDAPVTTGCYTAPAVQEAYRLTDATVNVHVASQAKQLRKYSFDYNPITAYSITDCSIASAGQMTLKSLTEYGTDTNTALRTMRFSYKTDLAQIVSNAYVADGTIKLAGQAWPVLSSWDNGFGGAVNFSYAARDPAPLNSQVYSDYCWVQYVVTSKTVVPGVGQPSIITTYTYGPSADAEWPPVPMSACNTWLGFYLSQRYVGFDDVTETNAAGVTTEHCFNTSRPYGGNSDGQNQESLASGRERETWVWVTTGSRIHACDEPAGAPDTSYLLRHVVNTWQTAGILSDCHIYTCLTPSYLPHFVYLQQSSTTEQDGSESYTQYGYDIGGWQTTNWYGDLLTTHQFVGAPPGGVVACDSAHNCTLSTARAVAKDTTSWMFVPAYEAKNDPRYLNNPSELVSCTRFYYDGQNVPPSASATLAHGLVTAQSVAISVAPSNATTCDPQSTVFSRSANTYTAYDSYGNVVAQSVASDNQPETVAQSVPTGATVGWIESGLAATLTAFNTSDHMTPSQTTNALGQVTTYVHNDLASFAQGTPAETDEPNGQVTKVLYDIFGRPASMWDSLDTQASPTKSFSYAWGAAPNQTLEYDKTGDVGGQRIVRTTVSCVDGFGREVEQRTSYLDTSLGPIFNSVRTDYDVNGRKATVANAVAAGTSSACDAASSSLLGRDRTMYAYDALGNVAQTSYLAANQLTGKSTQVITNGLTTTECDELGHPTTKVSAPLTRSLTVYEAGSSTCAAQPSGDHSVYTNDALGRLVGVVDPGGATTTIQYDLAGRKVDMVDPDMGHWTYDYFASGKLKTQTDARGTVTNLQYDALDRLRQRTYAGTPAPGGGSPVSYVYDANASDGPCAGAATSIGHLATMNDVSGQQWSCYDVRGREIQSRRSVNGIAGSPFDIHRTYDAMNSLQTLTYPDSEVVTYSYGAQGEALTGVSSSSGSLVTGASVTAWGAPLKLTFGNGQSTTYTYDPRERLVDIRTGTATVPGSTQHLTLSYDDASNVTAVTDATTGELDTYTYDRLNRLTGMAVDGMPAASYGYLPNGNLIAKQEGLYNANALNLGYGFSSSCTGQTGAHAASSVTGAQTLTLSYDCNGNLIGTSQSQYRYDADNRLTWRTDGSGVDTYAYDGNGTLLKRTMADGSWTVYVGGVYELHSDGSTTKYYSAMGNTIAMRQAGTLFYVLSDHLGSTTGLMDTTGALVAGSLTKYWPYGATRSGGATRTDKLYTGQQQEPGDAALGLYNYKARFYSTTLGRFVSADSADDGLNRYAYVHDNPLRYVDPTGHGVTGGGDSDEGSCPANDPNCFGDSSGPVGGNGGTDNHYDNGGNVCGTYQCMLADPNCNELCRGMAACALGAGICDVGGGAVTSANEPDSVVGESLKHGTVLVGSVAASDLACEAASVGTCTPFVIASAGYVACYYLCDDAASAVGSVLTKGWHTFFAKGDDQRKPGKSGSFKGTDALRRENKQASDAAREVGLSRDQQQELHREISGQGYDYQRILEIARQIKRGNR